MLTHNILTSDPNSLLTNAIITFMTEAGEAFVEDPLRTFYRTKVRSIGAVLEQVTKHAKSLLASNPSAESRTATLQEANHIIIVRLLFPVTRLSLIARFSLARLQRCQQTS